MGGLNRMGVYGVEPILLLLPEGRRTIEWAGGILPINLLCTNPVAGFGVLSMLFQMALPCVELPHDANGLPALV